MKQEMQSRWPEILEFWFGTETPIQWNSSLWWRPTKEDDWNIRQRFEYLLKAASRGELDQWEQRPKSCLALIVLFDQLSRSMYRGTAQMFAFDSRAISAAKKMKLLWMSDLAPEEQLFVYVALMHSEDLSNVTMANSGLIELHNSFSGNDERSVLLKKLFFSEVKCSKEHLEVIKTFNRYPHRNRILGRKSTEAERLLMHTKFNYSWTKSVNKKDDPSDGKSNAVPSNCFDIRKGYGQNQMLLKLLNPKKNPDILDMCQKTEKTFFETPSFSFGREPLCPIGLSVSGKLAYASSEWQSIVEATKKGLKNSPSSTTGEETINTMIANFTRNYLGLTSSERFLLCFTLYPFERVISEKTIGSKGGKYKHKQTNCWFFCRYFPTFYKESSPTQKKTMLALIVKFAGWQSLKLIAEAAFDITKDEDSVLCVDVAKFFADALIEDMKAADEIGVKLKEREDELKQTLPREYHSIIGEAALDPNRFVRWISRCPEHAPRYHSALDRKTGLARRVSRLINPLKPPPLEKQSDPGSWKHTKMVSAKRYKKLLRRLNNLRSRAVS